jgi:hypothetical protein
MCEAHLNKAMIDVAEKVLWFNKMNIRGFGKFVI